jgi:hypothetical protein
VLTFKDDPDLLTIETVFDEWDLSAKLPDHMFKARIPTGARRVGLHEMISGEEGEQE